MDSLLASYGSSDEEEDLQQQPQPVQKQHEETSFPSRKSSTFPSLPPPKSSSALFFSLPPPKSEFSSQPQTLTNFSSQTLNDKHDEEEEEEEERQQQREEDAKFASKSSKQSSSAVIFTGPGKSSSLSASLPQSTSSSIFSFLPPPKTNSSDSQAPTDLSSSLSNTKRVVQFKLPINPSLIKSGDHDDEDDDDDERKESKVSREFTQTSSVKSFLSSIPAPKNSATLGALPSSSGSGRRSIVEADVPKEKYDSLSAENEVSVDPYVKNYEAQWVDGSSSTSFGTADGSSEYAGGGDASNLVSARENYVNYGGYGGYGDYGNYGQYESNGLDGSAINSAPDVSGIAEHVMRVPGKRGRNEIPQEIVEVRQDELMKNRPREDQARLTGIAFGPSYQPVSTKGKPTKLHKRKHQIGSLYYDMKQKEMELAERRAKGFLTKAETQAKYGW